MGPGGGRRQARVWLGLLLPLAMLRGFASHEGSQSRPNGPALASAVPCGFVPAGRIGLWQCGRAAAACFSARLATRTCPPRGPPRMQSGGGDRAGSSMNELERAREALAGIIAKRKGLSRGGLAGTAASPHAVSPSAPWAAAPETLGAKMAATFPPKAPAQDPAGPSEAAPSVPPSPVPANHHADSGGVADGASPKTQGQASPKPVQGSEAGDAGPEAGDAGPPQKKKGRRAVAAVPPVDWVVPEHAWSIVDKSDQGVVQAKMNLQEFEAANGGWADGQDWAVDTNYAKGSEAPAAAQLGKIRRGKGAGEQAKVNEMFRRAKFNRGEAKMMSKTNWKDDWLDTFDRAESAPSEDAPGADAARTLQARGQEARSLSVYKVGGAGGSSLSEADEKFAQEALRPDSMGSVGERRAGRDEEEPTTVTHAGLEKAEVERDLRDASQEQESEKDQQHKAQRGEAATGQPAVVPPSPPTFASRSPPPSPVTSSSTPPPPPRPSLIDMNPSSHADGGGAGGSRLGGDGGGGGRGGMGGGGGGGGSTSTVSARSLTTAAPASVPVTLARSETSSASSAAPAVSNVQALQPAQATSASFSAASSLAAAPAPSTTLPAPRLTPSSPERGPPVVPSPESSSAPSTTSTSARASPSVSGGGGGGGGGGRGGGGGGGGVRG